MTNGGSVRCEGTSRFQGQARPSPTLNDARHGLSPEKYTIPPRGRLESDRHAILSRLIFAGGYGRFFLGM